MKKFWEGKRSRLQSTAVTPTIKRNTSSTSLPLKNNNNGGINGTTLSKRTSHSISTQSSSSATNQTTTPPNSSYSQLPTRKQRMLLLKSIIHHADSVQKQYLVPKQSLSSTSKGNTTSSTTAAAISNSITIDNMSSIFVRSTDAVTNEINDKCYQRWHQVLQEGLVPTSVYALHLLEKTAPKAAAAAGSGDNDKDNHEATCEEEDEEESYFATMEGMEEEIQVMALLARAAALDNPPVSYRSSSNNCNSNDKKKNADSDGMEQINDMMKCTAMLLFHIVLSASSTPSSSSSTTITLGEAIPNATTNNNAANVETTTVAGYDGRVRHVMKLACVDVLTHAILDSVNSFDTNNTKTNNHRTSMAPTIDKIDKDQDSSSSSGGLYDIDEYTLWNIDNIKHFIEQEELGKDAVFGTPFKPPSSSTTSGTNNEGGKNESGKKLLEGLEEEQQQQQQKRNTNQNQHSREMANEQPLDSKDASLDQSQSKDMNSGEMTPRSVESIDSMESSDSSFSLEVHVESRKDPPSDFLENDSQRVEIGADGDVNDDENNRSKQPKSKTNTDEEHLPQGTNDTIANTNEKKSEQTNHERNEQVLKERHAKRHRNAKFLATRKFELIERLVAIDIVRFLMAEERERKLREKEATRGNTANTMLSSLLKKGSISSNGESTIADDDDAGDFNGGDDSGNSNNNATSSSSSEQITNVSSSQIFTAYRIKQIKRGAKIAGCGLALGTVFAITGGLAAPALAAGIGGVAALTGASTASSTALLAVLATFKAGAALFGVGGGGLAAYKMKKRTAGLSQFEIRRENVEQYMYPGASDEKMKRGIESMLPQLHTTIVVSGWLRHNDIADFQLVWGVQPTCKYEDPYEDQRRIRMMKRFYVIYNPPLVYLCESFMKTLQKRLKKDFNWDRIWNSLEEKYGANPDHILPLDTPHENEVFLSYEEKEMIDGVLNNAKIVNLRKRFGPNGDDIDFINDNDEISELIASVETKATRKNNTTEMSETATTDHNHHLDLDAMGHHEFVTMQSGQDDLGFGDGSNRSARMNMDDAKAEKKKRGTVVVQEIEMSDLSVRVPSDNDDGGSGTPTATSSSTSSSPSLQERMAQQREQQISFLKDKGVIEDESNLREGAGSPKMTGSSESDSKIEGEQQQNNPPPPVAVTNEEEEKEKIAPEEYEDDERCPVVWDWKRLYGTADIHTVTWESQMLSSLCHIVENVALEVSTQATKVALQFSVIGAIVTAVAIPSALITASKLIDDPYQIVVIRADEAGKELAKCLLMSDERRPVTLCGFSFGARVVYSCLRELARQQDIWEENRVAGGDGGGGGGGASSTSSASASKSEESKSSFLSKKKNKNKDNEQRRRFEYDREPASLVGDVIFIGLPRAIDKKVLTSCRRVTGGRLVNCYTTNDWLLSLMFVARGGTPCGTKPIKDVPGVENYDVTHLVESHTKYGDAIPNILQYIRFSEP